MSPIADPYSKADHFEGRGPLPASIDGELTVAAASPFRFGRSGSRPDQWPLANDQEKTGIAEKLHHGGAENARRAY